MLGAIVELPDYKGFMEELEDANTAREFLLHALGLGYEITEVKPGLDIRKLPNDYVSELAKRYWAIVFLCEYNKYGELQ